MRTALIAAIAVAAMLASVLAVCDVDGADSGFDVTDGEGRTFHFDSAAERIVTSGYAATVTVADAGHLDKIIATDKYSTYEQSGDEKLKDLNAVDLGSFYGTSNDDGILVSLVNLVESGKMTRDDPIILINYDDNESLRAMLVESGFTKVLMWGEASSYQTVIDVVTAVSMIVSGSEPESLQHMNETISEVTAGVDGIDDDSRTKALAVWYYNKEFVISSEGIMGSMLSMCNADNIGYRAGVDRYGDKALIVSLLEQNPGTIVFVNNSYFSAGNTLDDFYEEMFNGDRSVTVVPMGAQWNNCCPESADGLMSIAQCLYPEVFGEYQGEIGLPSRDAPDDGSGSMTAYVVLGVVIVIVAAALAVIVLRKRNA